MKPLLVFVFICLAGTAFAQQFGAPLTDGLAIEATDIEPGMEDDADADLKVKGTILAVCQVKGCWMAMDLGNGQNMRITFKDYGFFVPTDCSGKTAIVEGQLTSQTVSVDDLKHLAGDAGKSEEI
jgi:hypothetical protein